MTLFGICRNCCGDCKEWVPCFECCRCVPQKICVNVVSLTGGDCDCEEAGELFTVAVGGGRAEWSGVVNCGSLSIDLSVVIEEGSCNLYLESYCLGLTGGSRPFQELSIGNCLQEGSSFEFEVTGAGGCGNEDCDGLRITITPQAVIENPIPCSSCDCVNLILCVTYRLEDTSCVKTLEAEFNEGLGGWTVTFEDENGCTASPVTVEVFLEDDGYGGCQLRLNLETVTDDPSSDDNPTIGVGCSEDTADWLLADETARVQIEFKQCGLCNPGSRCCRNRQFPVDNPMPETVYLSTILHHTLTGCDTLVDALQMVEPIALTYDETDSKWKSERILVEGYCDPPVAFEFHWYCGSEFPHLIGPISYVLDVFCGDPAAMELPPLVGPVQDEQIERICDKTNPLYFKYFYQKVAPTQLICCCDTTPGVYGLGHEITE